MTFELEQQPRSARPGFKFIVSKNIDEVCIISNSLFARVHNSFSFRVALPKP